ncbi:MAG: carbamoyltransferase HypF [Chloroflexi bacterium]|nr:carbamoyltransferase HypF [Chloroflexota bacterium]
MKYPPPGRLRLEIHGAVQGVGFRPFVYRLATELALSGWVINDSRGVFIEVEGAKPDLQTFVKRLPAEKPPLSIINSLDAEWLEPFGFERFEIRHSVDQGSKTVLILPDVATCHECLSETLEQSDRRAHYAFTNCTNCGPRFSIVQALPYDRPNTTMHKFIMCPECQAEYDNPLDRRFHAQPNACPRCGPSLAFQQLGAQLTTPNTPDDALIYAVNALRTGQIVAVKGLGGFHLMADARNRDAIALLRERKPRPHKPLALMVQNLEQARTLVDIPAKAETLLTSVQSPIVLLKRRPDAPIADNIAPGNPTLGVMLPYTPLHHLLLRAVDFPVVATSGNLSDEPICTDAQEARERLHHIADSFLVHDRPIERHVDDSVTWILEDEPRLLRRARGYAPLPVPLAAPVPIILAVGAHLKNTIALSIENQVFISQHIGDLETVQAMNAFERVTADFLRLYDAEPVAIAHDMHPEYLSSKWALSEAGGRRSEIGGRRSEVVAVSRPLFSDPCSLIPIQHHHAHLASVLAENQVEGRALGVIWDGTGYGRDGTIWGGEFLLGNAAGFERVAHLRPFRLPGGDAAVKEPRRVAFAMLWEMYGDAMLEYKNLPSLQALDLGERRILSQMLDKEINAPITTSMGRLFDSVAALLDLHQTVSFEGQAAMALEFVADPAVQDSYSLFIANQPTFDPRPSTSVLNWQPLIEAILTDLKRHVPIPTIAARFHNTLVDAILDVAVAVGESRVALSGGCFQNRMLSERTATRLRENGFEVILHRQVPANDGGISLGQIAIAAAHLGLESTPLARSSHE